MGLFEEKQGNLSEAIMYYNKSLRTGNNNLVKGDAYFRLGHVYYDSLRNFELAQAYYDSAVQTMPPSRPKYPEIKQRQEVLNEFVKHYKTIKWNDSLLALAKMDTASVRKLVEEKKPPFKLPLPGNEKNAKSRSSNCHTPAPTRPARHDCLCKRLVLFQPVNTRHRPGRVCKSMGQNSFGR